MLCYLFISLAVTLGIILWILIMIEQHQDKVLNEQAILEMKKNGEEIDKERTWVFSWSGNTD